MKKCAVFGVTSVAAFAVITLIKKAQTSEAPREREARRVEKRREMFKKMREGMESMPDDFPPVMMFNNVAAIREDTDRILQLLETDRSEAGEPDASTSI